MRTRSTLLLGFALGLAFNLIACDRKWDFECHAKWQKGAEEVWSETFTYPQMDSETDATARCKDDMLEAKPKGATSALCKCEGKDEGLLGGLLGG